MQQLPKLENIRKSYHQPYHIIKTPQRYHNNDSIYSSQGTQSTNYNYSQSVYQVTRNTNYDDLPDSAIWRENQRLRDTLKRLNDDILYEMEKRVFITKRKQGTGSKALQNMLNILEQEKKNKQGRINIYREQLKNLQGRSNHIKTNVKQKLDEQMEQVKGLSSKLKGQIKQLRKKGKILTKDIQKCPQLAQIISNLDEQLYNNEKKTNKQKKRLEQVQKQIKEVIQKNKQVQKSIETMKQNYEQLQRLIEQQQNRKKYEQKKLNKQNMNKSQSHYKKGYLNKLKQLQIITNNIKYNQKIIEQTQINIQKISKQIQTINTIIKKDSIKILKKQQRQRSKSISLQQIKQQNQKLSQSALSPKK